MFGWLGRFSARNDVAASPTITPMAGEILATIFARKPTHTSGSWRKHYIRLTGVRSVNFEGISHFGRNVDPVDPRHLEKRIEAFGVFDRHSAYSKQGIEIY